MQQASPGQANTLVYDVVTKDGGEPIDEGTVAFYLRCMTGTNANKWWDGSAFQAEESSAGNGTYVSGSQWSISIGEGAWTVGARYRLTARESGSLNLYYSEDVICEAISTGIGSYKVTITIEDADGTAVQGAAVWVTTDADGTKVQVSAVSDTFGHVTFRLDTGTYYCFKDRSGHNWTNPETLTITASDSNAATFSATSAYSSTVDTAWTRTTLCDQLVGELAISRSAPSGSGGDKLANLVELARFDVVTAHPWIWRRKTGTISLSTATSILTAGTWSGTSTPTMTGTYSGSKADNWTVTVAAGGTIGSGTVTVTVTDYEGSAVASLSLGSTYTPETATSVGSGIYLAFDAGTLTTNDTYYVTVKHDTGVFPLRDYGDVDYSDFAMLDERWLEDKNHIGGLAFTTDVSRFESARKINNAATGSPGLAMVKFDRDVSTQAKAGKVIHVVPPPSGDWEYDFVYLVKTQSLSDDEQPFWEPWMNTLWHARAKLRAAQEYDKDSKVVKACRDLWDDVFERARQELDEHHVTQPIYARDGYGDGAAMAGNAGWGVGRGGSGQLRPFYR